MGIVWEKEGNTGDLWLKSYGGKQYLLFMAVGMFIMLGGVAVISLIVLSIMDGELLPMGGVMIPFGLLFFVAGLSSKSRQFDYFVHFDLFNKRFEFYRDNPEKGYSFPLSDIDRILLNKEVRISQSSESSSTRVRRYNVYVIYLIKTDGAVFWLDTFASTDELQKHADMLMNILQVSVEDRSGASLAREMRNPYRAQAARKIERLAGVDIQERDDGSKEILLKRRITATGYVSLFLIFFFMGGLAGILIFSLSQSSVILAILFSPVALVPVGIILFIIFLMQKRYRLILRPESLEARIEFKSTLLNRKLGKQVEIPKGELRTVRLNRFEGGGFRLQLGMSREYEISGKTSLLFSAAAFGASGVPGIDDDQNVLPLWEMTPNTTDAEGASFADLAAVEQQLQDYYQLER